MGPLEKKALDVVGDSAKGVLDKLLGPAAEELGIWLCAYVKNKLGTGPYWGPLKTEERDNNIIETLEVFADEFSKLPDENKKELTVNIIAPIIDSLIIYFEEPNYKEMFGKLLASSFDNRKSHAIHPSFVEIIKQLNDLDAKLLKFIKEGSSLPYIKIFGHHSDGALTPYTPDLFVYEEDNFNTEFDIVSSLENLERLKLITIRNDIICFDKEYEVFKSRKSYKIKEYIKTPDETIQMHKYRVELTQTGINFTNVCC